MFDLDDFVNKYVIYADTSSLMCEKASDFFEIKLLSALQRNKKKLRILSNVEGELNGLARDREKSVAANKALTTLMYYRQFKILEYVNYQEKCIADQAFLHVFLNERTKYDICLLTEDKRLAKDIILNIRNIDSTATEYELAAVQLRTGEPVFWDIDRLDAELELSDIENYSIKNENENYKMPISFTLDNSATMVGERLDSFKKAMFEFVDRLKYNDMDKCVEYSISIFDGFKPRLIKDFTSDNFNRAAIISGQIPFLGKSLDNSLNALERRLAQLDALGRQYYKPWIVVLSDGLSFDNVEPQMERIRQLDDGNIVYLPFMLSGVESSKELNAMVTYKNKRPLVLIENKFKEMFDWLYLMLAKRITTPLSEGFKLDRNLLKGWAK